MKESKRNTTMLIIITIAVFLVAVLGATFAYFATERNVTNAINANVQTASSMYSFSATSNGNIEMNIAFNEMSEANVSTNVLKSDNATIEVNLASPSNDMKTTCTYDIVWVWDSDENNRYTSPDVTLPYAHQFEITENQYNDSNYKCASGYDKVLTSNQQQDGSWKSLAYCQGSYNYEFSASINGANETDLSKLETNGTKVILQKGTTIESTSTTSTVKTHDIAAYIYNLPVDQKNLFNKNFKAHVTIDSLNCKMESLGATSGPEKGTLAYHVINTVYKSDANQASIGANQTGVYFHDENLANGAGDNSYRYSGVGDPEVSGVYPEVSNYVCFDGDDCTDENNLYRIISVDGNTNQTKVIKATAEIDLAWDERGPYADDDYGNVWEGSTLKAYLNEEYLTSLNEKDNLIDVTTWSVGGVLFDSLENKTIKEVMDVELNNSKVYSAKIGLLYISEYAYSSLPDNWTSSPFTVGSGLPETEIDPDLESSGDVSTDTNWLSVNEEWLITPAANEEVWYSFGLEGIITQIPDFSSTARPTFNLKPSVKITNADTPNVGSKTNPMIIV